MKTSDLLLILFLIFIFNFQVTPTPSVAEGIDINICEAIVCIVANDLNTDSHLPEPTPVVDCNCDGTKKVKSPDGITDIPCPCPNCTCKSNNSPSPEPVSKCNCGCTIPNCTCHNKSLEPLIIQEVKKDEEDIYIMSKQMLYFGAGWCNPCVKFIKEHGPELIRRGWGLDTKKYSYIKKIDYDKYPNLAEKYKIDILPTFIILKDGVEVDRLVGYHTAAEITQFWSKHFK